MKSTLSLLLALFFISVFAVRGDEPAAEAPAETDDDDDCNESCTLDNDEEYKSNPITICSILGAASNDSEEVVESCAKERKLIGPDDKLNEALVDSYPKYFKFVQDVVREAFIEDMKEITSNETLSNADKIASYFMLLGNCCAEEIEATTTASSA